ncbi:MAG: peptide ABC transporter substrate-binding protein [Actinobacteria bacterium]|nr:peptide ABC transporter substrate-binding protein [Actinomycetota bacterium]
MDALKQSTPVRVFLLLFAVAIFTAACGGGGGTSGERIKGGTIRVEESEPDSLDANTADDSEQIVIEHQLYRGLVDYNNTTAKVQPAVAEKWDVNANATEFTFHLRKSAVFSNGEPCDAQAFVRGWSRATSKALASPVAYHAAGIKGFADQQSGKTTTLSGIEAVDATTFKVTLAAPDGDFVVRTGHPVFSPAPKEETIAGQKPSWAENPIGNGPFMMKEAQKHNQVISLVPNLKYYGAKPFAAEVDYKIIADFDTAYTDFTRIPPEKFKEAKAANPGKYIIRPTAGINYISLNILNGADKNADFRKAASLAVDRQAISNAAFSGLNVPATGIIPPALPGYRKPDASGVGPCKFCRYDPTQAKQLFTSSGVSKTTPILLSFNGGAGHEIWMQAVAKQLETNLGVKTKLEAFQPFSKFITFRNGAAANGLMRNAWGMDYPTPDNFLYPLFDSRSDSIKAGGDNSTHYNNPAFDKLIDQARAETDTAKRLKNYQDAEDLVLADMPVIPMWWRTQFRLAALDKWGGLAMNAFEEPTVETAFLKKAST